MVLPNTREGRVRSECTEEIHALESRMQNYWASVRVRTGSRSRDSLYSLIHYFCQSFWLHPSLQSCHPHPSLHSFLILHVDFLTILISGEILEHLHPLDPFLPSQIVYYQVSSRNLLCQLIV